MRIHTYQAGETLSICGWFRKEHMATDWLVWFTAKTLISTLGQKDIPSPVTVELGGRKSGDAKGHI